MQEPSENRRGTDFLAWGEHTGDGERMELLGNRLQARVNVRDRPISRVNSCTYEVPDCEKARQQGQ
jgi:hypothetical protein